MSILNHDAKTLSECLEKREISAMNLMEATLDRIDQVNPKVNALVSIRDRKELIAEAKHADMEMSEGKRKGWLQGIPMAIKDLSDTVGILSTKGGSPMYSNRIPDTDDLFVRRLKEAGAIIIGKSNAPELGLGSHTYNTQFGRTLNPYDTNCTPGGSSGGAAVAVATRMLCVADGSDMMGSLRNPAGWCNIYSLRPTAGLVEEEETMNADIDKKEHAGCEILPYPISTVGPMARTPRDLSLLLETLATRERYSSEGFNEMPDISGYRIGWLRDFDDSYPMEEGILETCTEALKVFQKCDASVVTINAPYPSEKIWQSWTTIRSKYIADRLCEEFGKDMFTAGKDPPPFKDEVIWEVNRGLGTDKDEFDEAINIAAEWSHCVNSLMHQYDALALPSAQMWPFPSHFDWPKYIGGRPMDTYHRWMEVVSPATLAGLPCATIPAIRLDGKDRITSIGLQIFSGRGEDSKVLSLAQAYHIHTDLPSKYPPPPSRSST